jgi:hypothetical protein
MSAESIVRLVADVTVDQADWETFKLMVADLKHIVAEEGDQVLIHECYYDAETYRCLILEAYVNEQAFLNHLELIKPLSDKYTVNRKTETLDLLGTYSAGLVDAVKNLSVGTTVTHFKEVFRSK